MTSKILGGGCRAEKTEPQSARGLLEKSRGSSYPARTALWVCGAEPPGVAQVS